LVAACKNQVREASMGDSQPGYRIADLANHDRPRERLAQLGAAALNNAELVAILLRSGIPGRSALDLAARLLIECGSFRGLQRLSFDSLRGRQGIGPAKAAQIKAAIELARRLASAEAGGRPAIQLPEQAAVLLLYDMGALEQEHLRVSLLDTRNQLLRIAEVYRGLLNTLLIRIAEIFRDAVRANAAPLIVAHNYPSGDPTPSPVIWRKGVKGELGTSVDRANLDRVFGPCQASDRASVLSMRRYGCAMVAPMTTSLRGMKLALG
jgi:DNA repair protein RadC